MGKAFYQVKKIATIKGSYDQDNGFTLNVACYPSTN